MFFYQVNCTFRKVAEFEKTIAPSPQYFIIHYKKDRDKCYCAFGDDSLVNAMESFCKRENISYMSISEPEFMKLNPSDLHDQNYYFIGSPENLGWLIVQRMNSLNQ